ncbi:MAG: 30S ribosomal protein S6 modification protein RimK [Peptococcaceae bacterium BICA1-8]|nr:MAG: 30S ribosomal protein S6 modification protein RimK [Peptococcaceae bacterium BICA1-8]
MRAKITRKKLYKVYRVLKPRGFLDLVPELKEKISSRRVIPENQQLESSPKLYVDWPDNFPKPFVGLVKNEARLGNNANWPKFERFLKTNQIPYEEYEINKSDFIKKGKKYDIVVWRTETSYAKHWEAADKVEIIQNHLGKLILPNSESVWMDEDKVREQYLFEVNDLPAIKTFISHSKEEVMDYIENCTYPFISKDKTSACSNGVHLLKNKRQAKALCNKIFSTGQKTNESYVRQKDYVYFQEFVPNYGFDLRIIMVGDSYFGYYRYPTKGDYKASGSGIVEKKELPHDVMILAKKARECLPKSYLLAVDFLQDKRDDNYYIIETSIFIGIESCEQLVIDGVPGRYIEKEGVFTFEPGRFWLQELMMQELMKDWMKRNS